MTQAPVLILPDFSLPFTVECNALGNVIGVVLMEENRPITFYKKALKGRVLALSTYEKELYALVIVVKKWRPYLLGQSFVVRIDH